MKLLINDQEHTLIELKTFREAHQLPESFGVECFENKDYTGLASIEKAGTVMNRLRDNVLRAIPQTITMVDLMGFMTDLGDTFRAELSAINDQVNLKDVEIDYAVSGFQDVCQAFGFEIIRATTQKHPLIPFVAIYMNWLNDSVRLSYPAQDYEHNSTTWQVQIINTAYGRSGLFITIKDKTIAVHDARLACPAEGYMFTLLSDIASKVTSAMNTQN